MSSLLQVTCGIFLYVHPAERFLLCHATMSRHGWSIPKGLPEPGEDDLQAAARELKEETGIDLASLKVTRIERLSPSEYKKQRKILHSFLVVTRDDITGLKLQCSSRTPKGYPEVDRYKWVDLDEFRQLAHETQARLVDEVVLLIARS